MAKEKVKKASDLELAKMKIQNERTMKEVRGTRTKAEVMLNKEYARYQDALKKNDYKLANESLKMFNFIYKMKNLSDRFVVTLERVETIQDLFNMLQATSQTFMQIMSLDNMSVMKDMKKGLKTFKKKLRQYEAQMESVFDLIDNLFDERPNAFVRFFQKLFGKKEKDPKEILEANQAKFGANMAAYVADNSETTDNSTPASPTAPVGGNDNKPTGNAGDGWDASTLI